MPDVSTGNRDLSPRQPDPVPIAIRVYPEPPAEEKHQKNRKPRRPDTILILDTETTTDATQRLLFGSYRFIERGQCAEGGLFYPDDLPSDQISILQNYVRTHRADTVKRRSLKLLTLRGFLKKFFTAAYKNRCLVVGFNLPFDLSRMGFHVGPARRDFRGGFSLVLWTYFDKDTGGEIAAGHRPRIVVKHLDSKRALISFRKRIEKDADDLIPEDSPDGKPQKKLWLCRAFPRSQDTRICTD